MLDSVTMKKHTEPIFEAVLSSFRKHYEWGTEHGAGRLGKVLLTSLHTDACPPDHLETLFFSGLMGNINIDSVIPYILNMNSVANNDSEDDIVDHEAEDENDTL